MATREAAEFLERAHLLSQDCRSHIEMAMARWREAMAQKEHPLNPVVVGLALKEISESCDELRDEMDATV